MIPNYLRSAGCCAFCGRRDAGWGGQDIYPSFLFVVGVVPGACGGEPDALERWLKATPRFSEARAVVKARGARPASE